MCVLSMCGVQSVILSIKTTVTKWKISLVTLSGCCIQNINILGNSLKISDILYLSVLQSLEYDVYTCISQGLLKEPL